MPAISDTKYMVRASWDDAPHLTDEEKATLWSATPPHLRRARREGIPSVGIGRIYPYSWEKLKCEPFPPPQHFPRFYALDPGWNRTACLWGMLDPGSDVLYFYSEYYAEGMNPHQNAVAIAQRGKWIRGVSDPAAAMSTLKDGESLLRSYRKAGLFLKKAQNPVEAGLTAVWQRIAEGRLRVFETLINFKYEYNQYHRNEQGKVVKRNDHLMDAMRYGVMSGLALATTRAEAENDDVAEAFEIADRRAGF